MNHVLRKAGINVVLGDIVEDLADYEKFSLVVDALLGVRTPTPKAKTEYEKRATIDTVLFYTFQVKVFLLISQKFLLFVLELSSIDGKSSNSIRKFWT